MSDDTSKLATAQDQTALLNSANANQSSELGAYRTCINDLNVWGNTPDGSAAENAALAQSQKDCAPLGLQF